jgi:DNA-binding winged helix-turn-helix (wHTH) protein
VAYRFGDYELDPGGRELLRNSVPVHLTPKAFELLELLVERRPEAVSKADIHERLWPSTLVTNASLPPLVLELRHALGDDPDRPRYVRTVRGYGYAFSRHAGASEARPRLDGLYRLVSGDHEIVLRPGENVLGRSRKTASWLRSLRVSPRHARILVTDASIQIEDLGSRCGTFLGDRRIAGPSPLADGDEVRLGDVSLVFRAEPGPAARQTRPADDACGGALAPGVGPSWPVPAATEPAFGLGEWRVEPSLDRISRGSETVKLPPRVMQVLLCLAGQPGQLVTKRRLLGTVWADEVVSEAALTRCISVLRRFLGDDARQPRYVENIPRRGYRLIVATRLLPDPPAPRPAGQSAA